MCTVRVVLHNTIKILKNEEATVLASVDSDIFSLREVLFSPYKDKLADKGVMAANSISFVRESGKIPVRIINLKNEDVTIFKNTRLDCIESVSKEDDAQKINRIYDDNGSRHIKCITDAIMNRDSIDIDIESKKAVIKIITEFKEIFSKDNYDIGHCPILKHEIDVFDAKPIAQPLRRAPLHLEKKIDDMIQELEEKGIIRESSSPWSSPIVVVQKKSGDIRLCIDYRKLNSVTKRPIHPISDNQQLFDSLVGLKYFSALELSSCYYNVEIEESDREKAAFATRKG